MYQNFDYNDFKLFCESFPLEMQKDRVNNLNLYSVQQER